MFAGRVRSLALDQEGHIHVWQQKASLEEGETVSVLDSRGSVIDHYPLPEASASPFLNQTGIVWRVPGALINKTLFASLFEKADMPDVDDRKSDQIVYVGALAAGGGFFTFGTLTEMVVLHNRDGSVVNSFPAPLDSAYQAIGVSFPKPAQPSESSRVIWAAPTKEGLIYICLSGTLGSGLAYVALLDINAGRIASLIAAQLPRVKQAISERDLTGTIFPGEGAMDNQLVIARQRGIVAGY